MRLSTTEPLASNCVAAEIGVSSWEELMLPADLRLSAEVLTRYYCPPGGDTLVDTALLETEDIISVVCNSGPVCSYAPSYVVACAKCSAVLVTLCGFSVSSLSVTLRG